MADPLEAGVGLGEVHAVLAAAIFASSDDDTSVVMTSRSSPVGVAQDVVGEQPADLVAAATAASRRRASGSPRPVGRRRGRCTARSAASHCGRLSEQQVHRPRLLRVGERHRRERPIGLLLLGDDERRRQPGAVEGRHQRRRRRRRASPSRRRCTPATSGRNRTSGAAARYACDMRVVEPFDQRIVRRRQSDDRSGSTSVDARRDLGIDRRHDLAPGRRGRPCSRCRPAGCARR